MKDPNTFRNWLKWNLRGRPKCLIVRRVEGYSTASGKPIEENIYLPDYLVDEYWRLRGFTASARESERSRPGAD